MGKLKGNVKSFTEINYSVAENQGELQKESLIWKNVYKFDERGNELERICYSPNEDIDGKYTSKYDDAGNLIEKCIYDSDGSLVNKSIYKYDESNNKIEWNSYTSTDSLFWKVRKFVKYSYRYDDQGNEIEENYFFPNRNSNSSYKCIIKYDSKSNWTQKEEFYNGTPKTITERTIEYFAETK